MASLITHRNNDIQLGIQNSIIVFTHKSNIDWQLREQKRKKIIYGPKGKEIHQMEENKKKRIVKMAVGKDKKGIGRHYTKEEIKFGHWYADIELRNSDNVLKKQEKDVGYDSSKDPDWEEKETYDMDNDSDGNSGE